MTILCLDTSQATSVALVHDGTVLARARNDSGRHHAESITPLVRKCYEDAGLSPAVGDGNLEAVVVGTGPAPFTGLRAGLVSARVFAATAGAPVYGVSSLDIIARQALDHLSPTDEVAVVTDARRKEIYWALYRAQGPDDVRLLEGPEVGAASQLGNILRNGSVRIVSAGEIPAHSQEALAGMNTGPSAPLDAAVLARIVVARKARGEDTRMGTEPLYLRRPDIQGQPAERM